MSASFQALSNFIWSVADLLRGPYRPPQYERVMLPMTVLRRFDCVLEPTKEAVVKRWRTLKDGKVKNIDPILNKVAGNGDDLGFHNHSELDFPRLKGDPDNIGSHLTDYIANFSENVRKIFERFEFEKEIEKVDKDDWTIVMSHAFYYSSGIDVLGRSWADNQEMIDEFEDLFIDNDLDQIDEVTNIQFFESEEQFYALHEGAFGYYYGEENQSGEFGYPRL